MNASARLNLDLLDATDTAPPNPDLPAIGGTITFPPSLTGGRDCGEGSAGSHDPRSVHRDGYCFGWISGLSRPVRARRYPLRWGDGPRSQSVLYGESEGRFFSLSPPDEPAGLRNVRLCRKVGGMADLRSERAALETLAASPVRIACRARLVYQNAIDWEGEDEHPISIKTVYPS